jgi:hypothetical protein
LSSKEGEEKQIGEGLIPLSIIFPISFGDRSLFNRSAEERLRLSYITPSPFPLSRGRGTKGDRIATRVLAISILNLFRV